MPAINTNAIRAFQDRVHAMSVGNQKEVRLSSVEAKNLSHELATITAMLLEYQTAIGMGAIDVEIGAPRF